MVSSCLMQLSENAQSKLKTKFINHIWVSDDMVCADIRVTEGAVNAQPESEGMTTNMLHLSIHHTASL